VGGSSIARWRGGGLPRSLWRRPKAQSSTTYLTDFPLRTILNDFVGWAIIRRPNMGKPEGQSSDILSNAGKRPFSAVPTVPEILTSDRVYKRHIAADGSISLPETLHLSLCPIIPSSRLQSCKTATKIITANTAKPHVIDEHASHPSKPVHVIIVSSEIACI